MTAWNDTKLSWTDADLADVEKTAKAGERARIIEIINAHLSVPDSDCLKQSNPYHCPACSVRIDILADIKRGDK